MVVCIPTIMHTGTHFVKEHLFKDYKPLSIVNDYDGEGDAKYCFHVVSGATMGYGLPRAYTNPVVVPLRHPYRVKQAFEKRYNGEDFDLMHDQWYNMITHISKFNPYYLHLDDEERREKDLQNLNKGLGLNLQTDWSLQGSKSGTNLINVPKSINDPHVRQEYIDFYYKN